MKSAIFILGLIAVAIAAPTAEIGPNSTILRSESNLDGSTYNYSYETSDGIKREERGEQREIAGERGTVSRGSYSFVVDGVTYTVNYSAGENGFVAEGAHLPKPVEPLPVPTLPAVPTVLEVPTPELAVVVATSAAA